MPSAPFDVLGLTMLAMLLVALLAPPALVYEPVWELAAGLGYAACCAAVLTLRVSPRPRVAMTAYRFSLHRVAGNAFLVLVALHVAVMVAGDPFVLDYLGWTMPWHVLAGMLGAVALMLAVTTREPVLRGWLRLPGDPRLHGWSAIAAALLVAAHVLPTAGKPTTVWRGALLAVLLAALFLWATGGRAGRWPPPGRLEPTGAAPRAGHRLLLVLCALLLLLVGLPSLLGRWRG